MMPISSLESSFIAAVIVVFGLMIGSFLNVVIFRVPADQSIVWPGSHCPKCQNPLSLWENIPVLSWLVLAGKCRTCRASISWRYPVTEIATAGLFLAVFEVFGLSWQSGFLFVLVGLMVVTFWIDIDTMEIFDQVTIPGAVIGLLYSWLITDQFLYALAAVLYGVAILMFINNLTLLFIQRDGIGTGDFTLIAMLGAWLGLQLTLVALALAMGVGAMAGLLLLFYRWALGRRWEPFAISLAVALPVYLAGASIMTTAFGGAEVTLDAGTRAALVVMAGLLGATAGWIYMRTVQDDGYLEMPFGPALVLGALGALFWGGPLVSWYYQRVAIY